MSLFSFGDISFSSINKFLQSPTGLLNDKTKSYNILKYPSDLGSTNKGHYMVIFINEQVRTQLEKRVVKNGDLPTVYDNRMNRGIPTPGSTIATQLMAALDRYTNGATGAITALAGSLLGNNIATSKAAFNVGFTRTIQRSSDVVALYMPDTLNFVYDQQYSDLQMSGGMMTAMQAGLAYLEANKGQGAKNKWGNRVQNMAPYLASSAMQQSDYTKAIFAATTGTVMNPMLEMIYSAPSFRRFRFDFMLYPRDEKEALEVIKLIERLNYHQAPELQTSSNGYFLIPPSEFDIKFYYNGRENPNIPPISTCVLENIDLDFAPNGFAAYEVPNEYIPSMGKTGMPVAIRLGLSFKETEYLTKKHFTRV